MRMAPARSIVSLVASLVIAATVSLVGGTATQVMADEVPEPVDLINFSFATWLGSGLYRKDDRRMGVLRMPLRYELRPPEDGKLGFRLLLPATLGYYDFNDPASNAAMASFVPGLEVQIPVNEYWTLKPFGHVGVGAEMDSGDSVYIYAGGVGSLVSFPWRKYVISVGNSVTLAEDSDTGSGETSGFSLLSAGVDVRRPLGFTLLDRQIDGSVYFIANRFFDRVNFLDTDGDDETIRNIYEVGITLGSAKPFSFWKLSADRVGIDYRFGSRGFEGKSLRR